MPPTLKRILWNGVPVAVVLAGLGFALAEAADLMLSANRPTRDLAVVDGAAPPADELPDPLPAMLRRTLPVSLPLWGFALVAGYEGLRRLIKGPGQRPAASPKVPAGPDVDRLLDDLLKKAEADRTGPDAATPPPVARQRVMEPGA